MTLWIMDASVMRDAWICPDQAAEFFDILTHDDRRSRYVIARATADGDWVQTPVWADSLGLSPFSDPGSSYYVTHNGFNGRRRESDRCRQVNAIMFDVDCHGGDHAAAVPVLVARLQRLFGDGSLPRPNLFVNTGRGVQFYYVLERSTPYRVRGGKLNERGLGFYRDVEKGLSDAVAAHVSGISGAKLDTSVRDFARVGRIPGSFNPKSGTRCELLSSNRDYWTLAALKPFCANAKEGTSSRPRGRGMRRDGMFLSRLSMLSALQERRGFDCNGSRENMCFVYYNTAAQVYGPEDAYEMTLAFNAAFSSPLPANDILQIRRTVDSVVIEHGAHRGERGFYPLTMANVADKVHLTDAEAAAIGYWSPSRKAKRDAAKRKTAERKAARNHRICVLYAFGYSQADVAHMVGCSPRTVFSVVNEAGIERGNLEESRKAQFERIMDAKRNNFAKNWQTSWVVKGVLGSGDGAEVVPVPFSHSGFPILPCAAPNSACRHVDGFPAVGWRGAL